MTDIIVISVIILIVGLALLYIIREKKKGKKCIGCPYARSCAKEDKIKCSCAKGDKGNEKQ